MAKSKYDSHVLPKFFLVECWARDGFTNDQIALKLGVGKTTFYKYLLEHPELSELLKKGKEVVDYEVENALLKKAKGHKETVEKPFKLRFVDYEDGKKVREYEEIAYGEEQVYVPPDTLAGIFWLKNRKPDKWRDKPVGDDNSDQQLTELIEGLKQDE